MRKNKPQNINKSVANINFNTPQICFARKYDREQEGGAKFSHNRKFKIIRIR